MLWVQLDSALQHVEKVTATIALCDQEVLDIRVERIGLREEVNCVGSLIVDLKRCRIHLSNNNLKPSGIPAKAVKQFICFLTLNEIMHSSN